jgi:hypothetical protein
MMGDCFLELIGSVCRVDPRGVPVRFRLWRDGEHRVFATGSEAELREIQRMLRYEAEAARPPRGGQGR